MCHARSCKEFLRFCGPSLASLPHACRDCRQAQIWGTKSLGENNMTIKALQGWTTNQTHAVAASYLAWTMDAFDFFILVFVLGDIAGEFHTKIPQVALAVTLTLAMRPVGAFFFGRLADRYGRRPILMINIAVYSLLSFATAFVPNMAMFLLVRAAFGFGMGGIWGISTSLAFESIK